MRKWQILPTLLGGALVLSQALPALAQEVRPFGPRHMGPHLFGPWMWAAAGVFLLVRVLVVIGLVALIWRLLRADGLWRRPDAASQIVRERYARGEINEEEYRKRLGTLA